MASLRTVGPVFHGSSAWEKDDVRPLSGWGACGPLLARLLRRPVPGALLLSTSMLAGWLALGSGRAEAQTVVPEPEAVGSAVTGMDGEAGQDAAPAAASTPAPEGASSPAAVESPAQPTEGAPAQPTEAVPAKPKDYREGWGFAGLPLANFNSDDGFGYGIKGAVYNYGKNQKPYKSQLSLQLFFTTRRVMYHELYFDAPRFRDSPWRLDMRLRFDRILLNNYFGIGNTVPVPEVQKYGDVSTLSAEEAEAQKARVQNYYTSFQSQEPKLILNLRRDLGGPLRLFNGWQFKYTRVVPHTAETILRYTDIDVEDDWTSFLTEQHPYGYSGGATGFMQLGMVYDSRDREPSPNKGNFTDASLRGGFFYSLDELERSTYAPVYAGLNITNRNFFHIGGPFVFGARVIADFLFGDVPFFALTSFGGLQDYDGLGGSVSNRGLRANRYRGKVKVVVTPELRFTPIEVYKWKQKFNFGLVAFSDIGRTWADYASDGELLDLHTTVGGGLRIAWNDNFLIRADVGKDLEEGNLGIYILFDHAF